MGHPKVQVLLENLRSSEATQDPVEKGNRLRSLVEACPSFVPALISLSRHLVLHGDVCSTRPVEEVHALTRQAVLSADRAAEALVELAHVENTMTGELEVAAELFEEAERKLLLLLEDVLANRIEILAEVEEFGKAQELLDFATKLLPNSVRVEDAAKLLADSR